MVFEMNLETTDAVVMLAACEPISCHVCACNVTVCKCRALSHKNDKYDSLLHEEQQKNQDLNLLIRDTQAQVASKEKDMEFLRAAVGCTYHQRLANVLASPSL